MKIKFIDFRDYGEIHILPQMILSMRYSCLTLQLSWWTFELKFISYNELPSIMIKLWYLITLRPKLIKTVT